MTTNDTTWGGYLNAAATTTQPLQQSAPNAPTTAASVAPAFDIQQVSQQFSALPPERQLELYDEAHRHGIQGDPARVMEFMHRAMNGNDAMTATPNTLSYAVSLSEQQFLENSGRASTNANDIALLQTRVENYVKQLQGQGLGRDDIVRAVEHLGSTPELRSMASEMAEKQLAPQDFALLNGADLAALAPATLQTAAPNNPSLQNAMVRAAGGVNFLDEERRRTDSYRVNPGPVPAFAGNISVSAAPTESLSIADALDFAFEQGPTRGLPNLKSGPSRGGPDFA